MRKYIPLIALPLTLTACGGTAEPESATPAPKFDQYVQDNFSDAMWFNAYESATKNGGVLEIHTELTASDVPDKSEPICTAVQFYEGADTAYILDKDGNQLTQCP